jgi:glucose/arabinose dehydrogenase
VLRYPHTPGSLEPSGLPDTIVLGLRDTLNHAAKSIALGRAGDLYVSIGAPGNACMAESRTAGSRGMHPCPLLETSGGIWRFDANRTGQSLQDGERFATGLRNVMALGIHPETGDMFAAMHGRDMLHQLWPELYSEEEGAENPAEEFVIVSEGSDFGWPYCYQDALTGTKVLAPEYGGDGIAVGRCGDMDMPIIGFPGHWAPNDLEFYTGDQFPSYFHGGVFLAFHGSWNRAPLPQDGYRVVFIPAANGRPSGEWHVFADGFMREGLVGGRTYRPVGLALGPDGSVYVSDSTEGRIWRVVYAGTIHDRP